MKPVKARSFFIVVLTLVGALSCLRGAAADDQHAFFETKIRPVLSAECYECHGATKQKGGLRLDYRDGILEGGDSGAAVVAGDPEKSLLFQSITHRDKDLKMPKDRAKLDDKVIADFAQWIKNGRRGSARPQTPRRRKRREGTWIGTP